MTAAPQEGEELKLVAELRTLRTKFGGTWPQFQQAADLITTLRTENAELRKRAEDAERDRTWISLAERTPPEGVEVLRYPGWAAEISIDQWMGAYKCFLMDIEEGAKATHWMPLPRAIADANKETT